MAGRFDEFSKHLATRHSRRGLLKFLGAGVFGAVVATVFPGDAAADPRRRIIINGTLPLDDLRDKIPLLNQILPNINALVPRVNQTLPNFNQTLPGFNQALPGFNEYWFRPGL